MNWRRAVLFLTLIVLAAGASACGKKGPPESVPGGNYPTVYPKS